MDSIYQYDALSKYILSNKQILANIMKECIAEYRSLSINEIISYIEDGNDDKFITGLPTDDLNIDDKEIIYDILYTSRIPNSDEKIGMYINIEAQGYSPKYSLYNRATYYASRLFSFQKGHDSSLSNYDDLKRVFSIWIIFSPKKQFQNTINHYTLVDINNIDTDDIDSQLLNVIFINLGEINKSDNSLLRLLNLIFKTKESIKSKELENDYGIIFKKGEKIKMLTLGEGIEQMGIEKGMKIATLETTVNYIKQLVSKGYELDKAIELLNINSDLAKEVIERLS